MQRITPNVRHALYSAAATRTREQLAAATLPPHTLMRRAGLAIAQLAQALHPHARTIWIACGPGNNGGDGIEAAIHLLQRGYQPQVTWLGQPNTVPPDTQTSWERAIQAGVMFSATRPDHADLCIDALLGIGSTRAPEGQMGDWVRHMNGVTAPILAVDIPTGLHTDTGKAAPYCVQAHNTLSLLTLKPGLFTSQGRDSAGQVWLDDLGFSAHDTDATAFLGGTPIPQPSIAHASHKGMRGDVAVIGGVPGMTGAALLAASAALHAGAGRVMVSLLNTAALDVNALQPELMMRPFNTLALDTLTVACGCGGGTAIADVVSEVLQRVPRLVLDADALNSISANPALKTLLRSRAPYRQTVLTPHPLEAARLLGCTTAMIQADRLDAAQQLADSMACTVVLKGSGTVIASLGQKPIVNPTGNGLLATGGTGDVLAGLLAARLAGGASEFEAACSAAYHHGELADRWPQDRALTAGRLACALNFARPSNT
ncbi:MAG: hypothetical protein RIR09_1749 [Pseudomonadota bacterium]